MGTQPQGARGPTMGQGQGGARWPSHGLMSAQPWGEVAQPSRATSSCGVGTGVGCSAYPLEKQPTQRQREQGAVGSRTQPPVTGWGNKLPFCSLFPGGEDKPSQARSAACRGQRWDCRPERAEPPVPLSMAEKLGRIAPNINRGPAQASRDHLPTKPPAFSVFPGTSRVICCHGCAQDPQCSQDLCRDKPETCDLSSQRAVTFKLTLASTFLRAWEKSFVTKVLFAQTLEKASAMDVGHVGTHKNQG